LSLVGEIRRRQKAAMAEGGLRLMSEMGDEVVDRIALQAVKEKPDDLPAALIRPTVEAQITNTVADLVEQKQISPRQVKRTIKRMMEKASPAIQEQESKAYRQESGQRVQAPSTIGGAATAVAVGPGFPWLLTRGSHLWGQKPKKPMTLGESFKFNFIPSVLPFAAGFEGLTHALAPLSDPLRRRGERSYLASVGESFKGAREGLAESGADARARYGAFGIPIQMFHGIMNPVASLAYLGQQVGGAFKKPDYATWA